MDHLVLTVIAADQPGLVERVAQCIAAHGGNWLESRMSRMAGQFAGILRVAVPAEGYDELVEGLQGLSAHGIRVMLAQSGIEPACTWKPILLDLVGNDRPGIVRDITRLLARLSDPRRTSPRPEFTSDGRRIYFLLTEREADVWTARLEGR